jgi:uncharacterized membrane protein
MGKDMKHIIRAIILLVILFLAAEYFQNYEGIAGLISVLAIIAFMYLIAAIIAAIRRTFFAHRHLNESLKPAETNGWGCSLFLLMILLLALTFVFRKALGEHSFSAFQFTDSLLQTGASIPPVVSWGILGLLVGAIYGSFVAWRKYKLHGVVNLIPIEIFIMIIAILYNVNHPLEASAFVTTNDLQTEYAYGLVTATEFNSVQDENAKYKPSFLLDNNDKTAWITEAYGNSYEEVRFSFGSLHDYRNKHLQCVGFAIKNGYRKSEQLWSNFARAKSLAIKYNGRLVTNAVIKDKSNSNEEIRINPIPISSFDNLSISINDVYPGEKYPDRVAISELVPIVGYEGVSHR